jgi:DNA topoisomerase-1
MDLWIIEADGKVERFERMLKESEISGEVFATGGHLLAAPKSLSPIGIDRNGRDLRIPVRESRIRRLGGKIRAADAVYLATDPDDEGEVIADDIRNFARSLGHDIPIFRVRLHALHPSSLRRIVGGPPASDSSIDALPGTVRRVVDRLIGGALSKGGPVGRVFSAFLGETARTPPVLGRAILMCPALSGADYSAVVPVTKRNRHDFGKGKWVLSSPAAPGGEKSLPRLPPYSFGEVLLDLRREDGIAISDGARRIQSLYERGKISYPRTESSGLSRETAEFLRPMALNWGLSRFDPGRVPAPDPSSPHEALHPLADPFGIKDPTDRTIVERIARRTLFSGLPPRLVEIPDPASLPEWARDLGFSRPAVRFGPEREKAQREGLFLDSPDVVVLSVLVSAGLGRPSTLPVHVEKIVSRGVVNLDGSLSREGRKFLEAAPEVLKSAGFTRKMEESLRRPAEGETVKGLMEKVLSLLPEELRTRMAESLDDQVAPVRWEDYCQEADPEMEGPGKDMFPSLG